MEKTLVDFIKVLRTAEVKVSPAETLDAMAALEVVGYEDRGLFKDSLSMLLSKKIPRLSPVVPRLQPPKSKPRSVNLGIYRPWMHRSVTALRPAKTQAPFKPTVQTPKSMVCN